MRFFNFVVLAVITAPHNVPTSHISKTNLPIVSINVRKLELNWYSKDQSRKKGGCLLGGGRSNPPKALSLLNGAPSLHRGMRLPNAVQSK